MLVLIFFFIQVKELFDVQDFTLKYIDDENELVSFTQGSASTSVNIGMEE